MKNLQNSWITLDYFNVLNIVVNLEEKKTSRVLELFLEGVYAPRGLKSSSSIFPRARYPRWLNIFPRGFLPSRWKNHFRGWKISRKVKRDFTRGFILEILNIEGRNPRGSNFFLEEGLKNAKVYEKDFLILAWVAMLFNSFFYCFKVIWKFFLSIKFANLLK